MWSGFFHQMFLLRVFDMNLIYYRQERQQKIAVVQKKKERQKGELSGCNKAYIIFLLISGDPKVQEC